MATWLTESEKYALIALEVNIPEHIHFQEFEPGYWAWTDYRLEVPPHWREWLGTIQTEAIERSTLVLLCKMASKSPNVLDAEDQLLARKVWGFYIGLLLSSWFTPAHPPIRLSGSQTNGERNIRQQQLMELPAQSFIRRFPPVTIGDARRAARLGAFHEQLIASPPPGGMWRFLRADSLH
jgi:hypothetical protein